MVTDQREQAAFDKRRGLGILLRLVEAVHLPMNRMVGRPCARSARQGEGVHGYPSRRRIAG